MKTVKEKFTLLEDDFDDVIPAAELDQEPLDLIDDGSLGLPIDLEDEVAEEIEERAFSMAISDVVNREWETIDALNSLVTTFVVERPEDEEIVKVLETIILEKTTHVGMLQAVLGQLDDETARLIQGGEEKAERILNREVPEDLEEDTKSGKQKFKLDESILDNWDKIKQIEAAIIRKFPESWKQYWPIYVLDDVINYLDNYYEEENANKLSDALEVLDVEEAASFIVDMSEKVKERDYMWEIISETVLDVIQDERYINAALEQALKAYDEVAYLTPEPEKIEKEEDN